MKLMTIIHALRNTAAKGAAPFFQAEAAVVVKAKDDD
jgi:hypothetical protein